MLDVEIEITSYNKEWKKDQQSSKNTEVSDISKKLVEQVSKNIIFSFCKDIDISLCRRIADECTNHNQEFVVVLGSESKGKGSLLIKYGQAVSITTPAHQVLKEVTSKYGGGGGGRETMAQAGGIPIEKIQDCIDCAAFLLQKEK